MVHLVSSDLDGAVAYIFRLDPDGHAVFTYVSDTCAEVYGFTAEEAEADVRLMHDAIHPEDQDSFQRAGQASVERLTEVIWKGRILRTDGRERPVTITSRPKRLHDGVIEWHGVVVDRHPSTDPAPAHSEPAEDLGSVDVLGMLGHDIGAPLAVIGSYAAWGQEVLDHAAADRGSDKADVILKRCLQVIQRQSQRLDLLRNDLIAMAAMDARRITPRPEPVHLLPRLAAAAELRTRAVRVEIDCPEDLVCLVQPGHLDQILANLVSNAERYANRRLRLRGAAFDGSRLRITVEDDGPGVPPEAVERLFARFAHEGTNRPAKAGSGLGLFIVRALAQLNGGTVVYEPDTEWTRFTVSLPRPPEPLA